MKIHALRAVALPFGLGMLLPGPVAPETLRAASVPVAPLKVGAPVTVRKPVDIARLATNPRRYVGRTVRLQGTVKEVCQGMGCWVEVPSPRGATFFARSLDESVLLPADCAGRSIVVQGVVTALPAPAGERHDHAEHGSKGHACPTASYVVSMQGVELLPAAPRCVPRGRRAGPDRRPRGQAGRGRPRRRQCPASGDRRGAPTRPQRHPGSWRAAPPRWRG